MEPFEISVEGFSGPLDLLCSLVESRQMEAANIQVAQLVRIYGAYLAKTRRAPIEAIAEFFYMVAGLLLQKTRALLPSALPSEPEAEAAQEDYPDFTEDELRETLKRYRPYRAAYLWLYEKLEHESRSFRRLPPDEKDTDEKTEGEGEPEGEAQTEKKREVDVQDAQNLEYNVGDLYLLARTWWEAYRRYKRDKGNRRREMEAEEAADWDGFGEPVPDEEQIQTRITELEVQLTDEGGALSLNSLCRAEQSSIRGIKGLVVTLLALLEMCRMGKIIIEQEALFTDVKVLTKPAGSTAA